MHAEYNTDMKQKNKLRVYLTHDTKDIELVYLLVDILNYMEIFDVFLSPFDLPGVMPQLDSKKAAEIGDCDLLIALFTRRSWRSTLVKHEIELARLENKTVIPLVDQSSKIQKIGELTGNYLIINFFRTKIIGAIYKILANVSLSQDKRARAHRKLKYGFRMTFSPPPLVPYDNSSGQPYKRIKFSEIPL